MKKRKKSSVEQFEDGQMYEFMGSDDESEKGKEDNEEELEAAETAEEKRIRLGE